MLLIPQKRYQRILLYITLVIVIGSGGFYLLGGAEWTLLDSIYMTIITLSTVGFSETHDLNTSSRIWTIIVVVFGVTGFAYIATQIAHEMVDFQNYRRKRMKNRIAKMQNHYIICGFGRMGEVICDELNSKRQKIVIIERRDMNVEILRDKGFSYIVGDATNEDTLLDAGLERAKGVVIVLGSDPDNLFVTMTVKTLNPDIFIITRCSTIGSNKKFKRAGADKVVNPYVAGGHKMAELLLEPGLNDSIEIITDLDTESFLELGVDQIEVSSVQCLLDKTLHESQLRDKYNLMVLAVIENDGKIHINPKSDFILNSHQKAVITGRKEDLARFKEQIDTLS